MKKNFSELVDNLVATTIDGQAVTSPQLRGEIVHYTSTLQPNSDRIPQVMLSYLNKVAMHSYRVTDTDINQLKSIGCSEDELYELTICAALGAGLARLNYGLALLNN